MITLPLTGGFAPMDEGEQVLRIYGVEYDERKANLTIHMINAQAQTMREVFRFKKANNETNEGAMNAFSYFAKVAMGDFELTELNPENLVNRYIRVEVVHNEHNGNTYANLGWNKEHAEDFDEDPVPEALEKVFIPKPEKPARERKKARKTKATRKAPQEAPEEVVPEGGYDLDTLLG